MNAEPSWLDGTSAALRPPPKLSLSAWADEHFRLSARTAEPGKWTTRSYQRGILDAITDPAIERVSVMKSARVGYTQCINAAIAYFMSEDPCPVMIVQPTVDNAKKYSREMIAPMLSGVPVLAGLVSEASVKTTGNTVLDKEFPGGVLSIVGANSGTGFRMVSRRVVIFDEVDAYLPSAGDEGDPIALGENRAADYWNRKIIAGSTPLVAGSSRIAEMFEAGDQRRFYVPCPECGHMDFLAFRVRTDKRGHVMNWPDDHPELACFECSARGCVIEESNKRAMLDAGEWRADAPFDGHASFHIWSAYSTSPNAEWGAIASEFVAATKAGHEKLKAFITTKLAETWQERGEAPQWEMLFQRREIYPVGSVPTGVIVLTAGVDVQKDRLVVEVVGWGRNKESWSIEWVELLGDTALLTGPGSPWVMLDELLDRSYMGTDGRVFIIARLAVDAGWQTTNANTQNVYAWARGKDRSRVMATKGTPGSRALIDATTPVDITIGGKRIQRGYRVWPIGVDGAKGEIYGWLRLVHIEGDPPPGYCHFPEHGPTYFQQLTAEHLVTHVNPKTRAKRLAWERLPNRENHVLDARILARVAAEALGISRMAKPPRAAIPARAPAAGSGGGAEPGRDLPGSPPAPRRESFVGRPRATARPGGWFGRRR